MSILRSVCVPLRSHPGLNLSDPQYAPDLTASADLAPHRRGSDEGQGLKRIAISGIRSLRFGPLILRMSLSQNRCALLRGML
ncbi:hypothetical protein NXC24_CH02235 [Rhizobium sp. NXC24]|nr:hypothetical protein NXC24_CH02235 [Rhizobium sp. NXC24]